nr:MAG TPA: ADP-ribosyltransferase exoenzyme [Caudoviricetes sp.]
MAKKSDNDPKQNTLARIRRTEAYAERVRTLFAATVNEILALNKSLPTLEDGEMFSFDTAGIKKQHEVERLLRQLHSVATMAIQSGVKLEWAQANAECDKLVQSCFGKKALETPEFSAWTQRNEAAMAAFIARSENGLNLSQRVWKSCRQLRDEMEVAITVAVGDGTSAATMSRSVRKYLNDPDLMFRRFRYKDPETGEWKRKWKKRVIGEDGKVHFIDYDKDSYQDEWTGPGYYKSSAQNAMRVARTETNIAYRRADNTRWQQMDFVLGQRVQLSRNHPKKDICDKLAGDYPPDFVFDGWHPQCFCFVTPILMDEEEIQKMNEAMLEGKEYKPRGKRITQYPENFKEWVRDNEDKILASHDIGTDPYFVRNNFNAVQDILNPKEQLTPLEIAEQRHANRTPEQEEAIRLKWQERQERIAAEKKAAEAERIRIERIKKTAQNVLKTATTRFADFGIDTVALEAAVQSGDTAIINAETRVLAQVMAKKQQQIKKTASNVIAVTSKYKDFTVDTDAVTSLNDALKTGNLSAINTQTRALAQQIVAIKKQLQSMSSVIPNAKQWSDQFTVSELQAAHDAVQNKLAQIASLPIDKQIKKLENEIKYVCDPTYLKPHSIYSTWKVSQSAYMQELAKVKHQQKVNELTAKLNILKTYLSAHTKATTLASLIAQAETNLTSDNLFEAEMYVSEAEKKKAALEAAQARRDAKKGKGVTNLNQIDFDDDTRTQERKDAAKWFKNDTDANDFYFEETNTKAQWLAASAEEKKALHQYTAGSSYITEPLRAIKGYYHSYTSRKDESERDVEQMTNIISRCYCTHDIWIKRDEGAWCAEYRWGIPDLSVYESNPSALVGRIGVDESFMSCGNNKSTYFGSKPVILNIYCPKQTRLIYAEPFSEFGGKHDNGISKPGKSWDGSSKPLTTHENEIILQRGTKFRITKAEYKSGQWYIDCEVLSQYPRPIESFEIGSGGFYCKFK